MSFQTLDERYVRSANALVGRNEFLDQTIAAVGVYAVYFVPPFLVALWFLGRKDLALRLFLAGVVAWLLVSNIIGTLYFRPRPEIAELGGQEFIFHRPTYSFPSDHATLFAALFVTLYLFGEKRVAWWVGAAGLIVSFCRVALGFHYPSDIVGGLIVGGVTAWILWRLRDPVGRFLVKPLIRLAGYLHL